MKHNKKLLMLIRAYKYTSMLTVSISPLAKQSAERLASFVGKTLLWVEQNRALPTDRTNHDHCTKKTADDRVDFVQHSRFQSEPSMIGL